MIVKMYIAISVAIVLCLINNVNCRYIEDNETSDYNPFGVHIFEVERECAMIGGMCVKEEDCVEGNLSSKRGLCPSSQYLGAECCFRVIARPASCRQHLGECMDRCGESVQVPLATDCAPHQTCCVLT